MSAELNIPDDIVSGRSCLANEVPWMTEGAIRKLDELLKKDQGVVEFGAGGSSLFFARRCSSVLSFETNRKWANHVSERARDLGIENLHVVFEDDPELLIESAARVGGNVRVVSVAPARDHDRAALLRQIAKRALERLEVVVCDNYSAPMFPESGKMTAGEFARHLDRLTDGSPDIVTDPWNCCTFDHPRWWGAGTRVSWR